MKHLYQYQLLQFFFLFTALTLSAKTVKAPKLDIIEKAAESLDQDALVVFDVDYTLIEGKDKILSPAGESFFDKTLIENKEKMDHLISIIMLQAKTKLVNSNIVPFIDKLKEKNIKVIALTAVPPGSCGLIPKLEDWRINQLLTHGLSFHKAFPDIESCVLNPNAGDIPALFKKGILFSGENTKGSALAAFLKQANYKPSAILFIDDRLDYIATVESHFNNVTSFHYTESVDKICQLNEAIAAFQLSYLKEKEVWLSDEEAEQLLSAGCMSK